MASLKYYTNSPVNNYIGENVWVNEAINSNWVSGGTVLSQASYSTLYSKIGLIPDGFSSWTYNYVGQDMGGAVRDIVYENGIFVSVGVSGSGGRVSTSTNAITWTARTSGTSTNPLYKVTYGGGVYVCVGAIGAVRTSTDAITWTTRTSGTSSTLFAVTYGNGIFVYGGFGGVLATSTNGTTWTARTSGTTEFIQCLTYGNGIYVYGGIGGVLATSTNAITWTARTSGSLYTITTLAYLNGIYVYGNNGGEIATSTDAITWTIRNSNILPPQSTPSIGKVIYEEGLYIYVASNGIIGTSTDAITWVSQPISGPSFSIENPYISAIAYGNGTYAATSISSVFATTKYTYNTATEFALPKALNLFNNYNPQNSVYLKRS